MNDSILKSILLPVLLIILTSQIFSQIRFNRIYGGSGGEKANAIIQTYDGNFVFTGSTTTYGTGYTNLWLVKINTAGDTLWTKNYGYDWLEEGKNLIQMPDSGFVIIAKSTSASNGLYDDIWLLRTDKVGDTLWTKFYGELWEKELPNDIIKTLDGGFAVSCFDNNSQQRDLVWLMKFDSNGDTVWTKKYGNILDEKNARCIIETADNGFLMGGTINITNSFSANDYYLIKTNSVGDTLWTKSYGYLYNDGVVEIAPTPDSGYFIVGYRDHFLDPYTSYDIWLLKINANGDSLWSIYYGDDKDDYPTSIHPTFNGEYIIGARYTKGTYLTDGMMLVKIDSIGDTLWTRKFSGDLPDYGTDAIPTSGGGYILSGYTNSFGAQNRDAWIVSIAEPDYLNNNILNSPASFQLNQNYPNPFNPTTKIDYALPRPGKVTLTIFDCLGRKIQTLVNENQNAGGHSITFDASNLTSGIYFYQLKSGNAFSKTRKMILMQ